MPLSSYSQIGRWLWKSSRGYRVQILLNILLGLLGVAANLFFVWATKLTIDIATHTNTRTNLNTAITLLIITFAAQIVLGIASRCVRATLGVSARNRMQISLFSKLLSSNWRKLREFHTGNLLNRIEQDVRDEVTFITESLPSFITTCMQFLGAFCFLFWMDSTLACVVTLIIPFFVLCSKLYVRKMRRLTHDIRNTESQMQAVFQECLQHVVIIKTLERTMQVVNKISTLGSQLRKQVIHKTKYSTFSSGLMNIGFACGYLFTFAWGVKNLESGLISYGMLIAFVQLVAQIQGPVRQLTRFIPIFITAFTAGERIMELEQIECENTSPTEPHQCPVGVRIENVDYSYTENGRKIFNNFSYDFAPGSITAVTGETGAGKTTLIRLLLYLLEPNKGRIMLYGPHGDNSISPTTRGNFSYVPQGNTLMSGSIRENLLLAKPDATNEELRNALTAAAANFVYDLKEGIDSICGEMGVGLSEGQAQRISIARALLKDSPILLFDESTSSLDAETEKTVVRQIVEQRAGRTLIFITHRPEVLRYCTQHLHLERNYLASK